MCVLSAALAAASAGAARPGRLAPARGVPFDLVVDPGQTLVIDTTQAVLTDTHGQVLTFDNGDVFLDSLEVKPGGTIVGQGPNPLRFFVSGTVKVNGNILVRGADAKDVNTLLTAGTLHQFGGKGNCGGGDGGTGNPLITQSSPKGGNGFGPKNVADLGGGGGESSLLAIGTGGTPCFENEDRHPAGGGGGSYATLGEPGNDGTNTQYSTGACSVPNGKSAVDPTHAPKGGAPGPAAFTNASVGDDFLGLTIHGAVGTASAASTTTMIVPVSPLFTPSDVGRFVGLFRTNGTWEDGTAACNLAPNQPEICPRSKYLLRRIVSVLPNGSANLSVPVIGGIHAGDQFVVYGSGSGVGGEIVKLRGGEGGGAGGNAVQSLNFPNPSYAFTDRVGAGGGGGGGILEIYGYGVVDLRSANIVANGGNGAAGENTIGFDHLGGGSGAGSGGMVRIHSAMAIDATGDSTRIFAMGGVRGQGLNGSLNDPVAPATILGMGHGGRGGLGVIQLHAPFDSAGIPAIGFAPLEPTAHFIPAPILGVPAFSDDPDRQRAMWFGIK